MSQPCILGKKKSLGSWYIILSIYCQVKFANMFWESFCLHSWEILFCSFLMMSLSDFIVRVMLDLDSRLGSILLLIFGISCANLVLFCLCQRQKCLSKEIYRKTLMGYIRFVSITADSFRVNKSYYQFSWFSERIWDY